MLSFRPLAHHAYADLAGPHCAPTCPPVYCCGRALARCHPSSLSLPHPTASDQLLLPPPPTLPQAGIQFSGTDGMLSFLPLAHSFDRIIEELALCVGGHIGYWRVRCCRVPALSCFGVVSAFSRRLATCGCAVVAREVGDAVRWGCTQCLVGGHALGGCPQISPPIPSSPHPSCNPNPNANPKQANVKLLMGDVVALLLAPLPHPRMPSPPPLSCASSAQGNVKLLMEDVVALKPTLFIAVPRILERVEDGGEQMAAQACRQ